MLTSQNEDGGWGQSKGQASDVIATGQSLYALRHVEFPAENGRLQKARQFLVQKQQKNGAWHISPKISGWSSEYTEKSAHWSTAWALMGLSASLK